MARVTELIVIGGGARSGKSRFALELALELGRRPALVATAEAFDDEMAERIRRHRTEREGRFVTIEEPRDLVGALRRVWGQGATGARAARSTAVDSIEASAMGATPGAAPWPDVDVVVVDCLTLWLSNLLVAGADDPTVVAGFAALERALAERTTPTILVTNEVGLGLVPESALGRRFRDLSGFLHQRLVARADRVHLAAMGMIMRLAPGPVTAWPARAGVPRDGARSPSSAPPSARQGG